MRWLYRSLIRLYPRGFRRRFEDEMLLIFDESVATKQGTALLLGDALASLFRRWVLRPLEPITWCLLALCGYCGDMYCKVPRIVWKK